MASKDITKIVLAGTVVCGIMVLFYIYKKRSKSQGTESSDGASKLKGTQTKSETKNVAVKQQQQPGKSLSTSEPTKSKIPQSVQTKPQTVKSTSEINESSISKLPVIPQDGTKAEGESIIMHNKATEQEVKSKPEQVDVPYKEPVPKDTQQPKSIPAPPPAKSDNLSTQQVAPVPATLQEIKSDQSAESVQQDSEQTSISAHTQEEQRTPLLGKPEEPTIPSTPVQAEASHNDTDNVRSQTSIVLGPKPTEDSTITVQNGSDVQSVSTGSPSVQENESEQPQVSSKPTFDLEKITKAIQQAKSTPANIDKDTIDTLVFLLRQKDIPLLKTALDCIVRCGSFSQNQSLLRESGCIQELTLLLQIHAVAARTGVEDSQTLLGSINNAIINLCMDIQNQARLEVCIPVLIDLITYAKGPDDVQLMSLKSLTNLSTTPSYHEQYVTAIPRLFAMMDGISGSIRLQAVKVLVNLSCNPEIIPDILDAKAAKSLLKCLEPQTDSILLLRVVTLLVNLVSCVKEGKINKDVLPSETKPAQPNSMYSVIFGEDSSVQLKVRVQGLTRHSTDNVSKQAIRLLDYIK